MPGSALGIALVHRDSSAERERGLAVLGQVRDMCLNGRLSLFFVPVVDVCTARERARCGDRDGAIPQMRAAIDDLFQRDISRVWRPGDRLFWWRRCWIAVPTATSPKPRPRSRGWRPHQRDEGRVIRDIWLLRMRALLARAHGDEATLSRLSGSLPRHGDIAWLRGAHEVGRGDAMTAAAPSGVVTFLFTDVEGSTRRWETDADGMRAALAAHDEVLRTAIEAHGGFMFKHTGDGVCAAFASPRSAVDAAVAAQRALELPVRMGVGDR